MADERQRMEYATLQDDRFFNEAYANNVYYEASAWDLRLIFGQLDQRQGKSVINQHTGITLSWPQVKILSYWLRGYVEFYEFSNGTIKIPSNGIPPELPPPTQEQRAVDPQVDKVYEIFKKLRSELVESQGKK